LQSYTDLRWPGRKEEQMIKYIGTKKTGEGSVLYVFLINGLQKEIREGALKQYPGCYEALPAAAKAQINANRAWMSKL
jgi:hypothetical protein